VVVSSKFDDVKGLGRHRIVNSILAKEIATEGPVHALSIVAKTPAQWEEMENGNVVIDKSPSCRGGDGSLPSK
jgi:BolA protein